MTMGQSGDGFYLPHPHTLHSNTYSLPYPYPVEMRNGISSPSPTGSDIPASSIPIPALDNFFNKNKSIFQPQAQCFNALSRIEIISIDDYGDGEERGRECEIWNEIRENYDK